MNVENAISPNDDQMKAFMEPAQDKSVYMVNLLKFKTKAVYGDGRNTELSGKQAYRLYGKAVSDLVKKFGGEMVFLGEVTHLMLGTVDDLWDEVAIVTYPSRKALMDMALSPEYQEIAVHRSAGLEGQLNIETIKPEGPLL